MNTNNVDVAPNPVNQGEKIAVSANNAESIEIYSMQGALIGIEKAETALTFVPTDDLVPGIYFMVIKGSDYAQTVKVIVK